MIQVRRTGTILELSLWMLLAIVLSGRFWLDVFSYGVSGRASLSEIIGVRYLYIIMGMLAVVFPVLYQLIFGLMPIASLRRKTLAARLGRFEVPLQSEERRVAEEFAAETGAPKEDTADALLASNVATSRRIANNIYTRAGVYLLIGVLIAFSGLAFFYTQTARLTTQEGGFGLLMTIAPRFGILFFIELVAFFFLKQYRSAMDEFRYYEAIKRNREETLALIRLATERSEAFPIFDLVKYSQYYSTAGKLAPGESTELLETKKMNKDEAEIFEKIIDAVTQLKKG
jgi:hypothetical protein